MSYVWYRFSFKLRYSSRPHRHIFLLVVHIFLPDFYAPYVISITPYPVWSWVVGWICFMLERVGPCSYYHWRHLIRSHRITLFQLLFFVGISVWLRPVIGGWPGVAADEFFDVCCWWVNLFGAIATHQGWWPVPKGVFPFNFTGVFEVGASFDVFAFLKMLPLNTTAFCLCPSVAFCCVVAR